MSSLYEYFGLFNLIFEIILGLIAPTPWTTEQSITISDINLSYINLNNEWESVQYRYYINDILILIQFLKIYYLIRALLNISKYGSVRSKRVCKMFNVNTSPMYSFRCLMKKYPFQIT